MQPPPDPFSVQRRALDVDDYIDVLRRHKTWILGPAFAALVLAVVVAFLWPDTYISEAVIRVVPPQVPERFVPTNVNTELSQRINSMAQSILSRGALTNIINTNQLYPRDRRRLPVEDVIEEMRKNIRIGNVATIRAPEGPNRPLSAFRIEFSYENRLLAQKVVSELVTRFIDENIRTRANQSVMTTDFLKDQWDARKRELDEIERKLTAFRMQNAGRLPEQMQTNMQALQTIETRLSNLNSAMSRVNQDKLLLESRLGVLKDQLKAASAPMSEQAVAAVKNERLQALDREILGVETTLAALREQFKDAYPDVQKMQSNLLVLRRTRENMVKEEENRKPEPPKPASGRTPGGRETRDIEGQIAATQSQIEARNLEMETHVKEAAQMEKALKSYQARVESGPSGMQGYEELIRDRALAQAKYEEMNVKKSQSESATELENRKQGETLELLDPASLPQTPTEPKRWVIILVGTGIGLLAGLFLAGGREMKDTSLKNLKDVRVYTQMTVLGSVPLLENDLVVRRRRRLSWLAWSTACLAGTVIMAGSILFYYANRA